MSVDDQARAQLWERERLRLTSLAYRILGSWQDAEDVVSQSWVRLAEADDLEEPQAWLTTVVTRLAIDAGRRAHVRRETYVGPWLPEPVATDRLPADVAETRSLLGLGLLRLMDELEPEDRAIFVLREAFDVPYAEISDCVGRSSAACRQVVSRTRAALRVDDWHPSPGQTQDQSAAIGDLVNAVSQGDVSAVVSLISDDCVLWSDGGGQVRAALHPVRGRDRVAAFLTSVSRLLDRVEQVHVNGTPAPLFSNKLGTYLYVLEYDGAQVTGIQVQANPAKLGVIGLRSAIPR